MVYSNILEKVNQGKKQLVVLIDPETTERLDDLLSICSQANIDMFFIGGSTYASTATDVLSSIRAVSDKDVVLFPGNVSQVTPGVDAVLFLSLLSGRNANFLIGHHVKAASLLKGSEVIPVGYLLIDGGRVSTTQKVTKTEPLSQDNVQLIVDTALAGQYLGHKLIYLEAGSGAHNPVHTDVIRDVKEVLDIPLIVGGGISSKEQLKAAYDAGADIVVIGNALEKDPSLLLKLYSE